MFEICDLDQKVAIRHSRPSRARRGRNSGSPMFKWIFGPTWLSSTYDYNKDMATVDSFLAPILKREQPDLSHFKSR